VCSMTASAIHIKPVYKKKKKKKKKKIERKKERKKEKKRKEKKRKERKRNIIYHHPENTLAGLGRQCFSVLVFNPSTTAHVQFHRN
jgi:hypothetical protein